MKKILFALIIVLGSFVNAQEIENPISIGKSPSTNTIDIQDSIQSDYKIKRISIGLKLGVPNIASLGIQYTLPFLNNHLAPYFEYSSYNYNEDEIEGSLKFSEFGASYFFNEKGRGLYLGIGLSSLKIDATYNDISLDFGKTGSGTAEIALNTTNLKLGLKTGGRIYFRLEAGYGIGTLPQTVSFKAIDNSNPSYTETTTEDIPEIPGISENGLIIGNIGLGLSF